MQRIAFQGEIGAHSERAARVFFREKLLPLPCRTFGETFVAVHNEQATAAVVPIENSLAGSVHQNYDLLLKYQLHITGEAILRISHHVMVLPGVKWEQVRRVYSHPQALEQCREFLEKIESRPLHGSPWQYIFYLDFEGTPRRNHCQKAIEHLGEITTFLRVLGSYEKGKVID